MEIESIVLIIVVSFVAFQFHRVNKKLDHYMKDDHKEPMYFDHYDEEINETETPDEVEYEKKLAEREQAFDARIERLKGELDKEEMDRKSPNQAEVLHPDVENLPHDSIPNYETNPPDVEYTN